MISIASTWNLVFVINFPSFSSISKFFSPLASNIGINIYPYKSLFKSVEDSSLDKFIEYAKKIDLNKFMEYAKEINFNKYVEESVLSEFVEYAKKIDPEKYGKEIDLDKYSEDIKEQDKKKWVVDKESTGHVRRDRKNLNFFPWKQKHQK